MSPRLSRISVLEQVPLFEGGDVRRTLGDLVRLGRGLEESGYHRLWLAEHHSTGSFLSSAPDLLMMHILDATDRIRLGSGGAGPRRRRRDAWPAGRRAGGRPSPQ